MNIPPRFGRFEILPKGSSTTLKGENVVRIEGSENTLYANSRDGQKVQKQREQCIRNAHRIVEGSSVSAKEIRIGLFDEVIDAWQKKLSDKK